MLLIHCIIYGWAARLPAGVLNPHEGSLITDPLKSALRQAGALQAAAQVRCAGLGLTLREFACGAASSFID